MIIAVQFAKPLLRSFPFAHHGLSPYRFPSSQPSESKLSSVCSAENLHGSVLIEDMSPDSVFRINPVYRRPEIDAVAHVRGASHDFICRLITAGGRSAL